MGVSVPGSLLFARHDHVDLAASEKQKGCVPLVGYEREGEKKRDMETESLYQEFTNGQRSTAANRPT